MIGHMRHGSPPRLMALQSILSPNRRESLPTPSVGVRMSGARIVFSCGFDSIPFDCGVQQLQKHCIHRFGRPAPRIKGRVRAVRGGVSGGTVASLKATLAAAARRPALFRLLADPFALSPGFKGPAQPSAMLPYARLTGSPPCERLPARYNAGGPQALGDLRRRNGASSSVLKPDLLEKLNDRLLEPPPDGGLW